MGYQETSPICTNPYLTRAAATESTARTRAVLRLDQADFEVCLVSLLFACMTRLPPLQ
jgi:hypothetical protein